MQNAELPPYDAFYSKFSGCNPLEAEYVDYVNLLKKGLTTEQPVVKLELSKPPQLGLRNINACNKYGSKNKRVHSKTFCAGIKIEMLYQL